ncbi:MAG: PAS domain S-box protein [Ferruginibacter sp.]
MGTEINIQGNQKTDPSNLTDKSIVSAQRSAVLGFIAFLVLAFLVSTIIYERTINLKKDKKEEALTVANNARVRLQESLSFSLSATKTLSFFIQNDGSVRNFDSIASQILHASDDIDALQLVPGGVIRYIYPLKGNEKAMGYDILKDPARNKEAFKAIEKKEIFFAGPFELKQGGMGVVGRLPVFRNNKFWGFTAVIIRMPTLLKSAGIDSTGSSGYYFQLSKINPDTRKEEYFIPHQKDLTNSYAVSVNVPNGEWKLSVIPVKEYKGFADILILAILGLLFSILGAAFVYAVSGRPKKLDDLVKVRTKQLKESEENYKVLFERSPLPLWIYDLETYKFLDVNDAAVNLYGYSREEFLQMDLMAIRREEDIEKFLRNNKNGTDELRHAGVWTHIKKNKEAIEVLIFSRNIFYKGREGRLVLVMDVSEKIKVENELIKSEEKYRSLIEQASDGIILYSFDGTIHSFNKAAYTQTGYTKEEFEKLNMKDLFFESGIVKNRAAGNKIKAGKTTTLYRKLKRKDGSVFLVELNARMLPDAKIFAIVRDITEREKIETALVKSEEKYRTLIERVTDAFISLDNNGNYTYVNKSAGEIYKIKAEELVGKNIWTTFPDGIDRAFYNKCNDAMNSQEYQYLEEYYPPLDKWFENHIYPSKDGLTIFFKDVTEIKEALLALKEKEIKYRSLIEQASDGIVISDVEGKIIEVNKSMCSMLGFSNEEMLGKYSFDFQGQHDTASQQAIIEQLQEGQSFLYERKLLKKDGTEIDVEINSKMADANSLIGFIRDITERRKNEDVLQYQARLLEVVSDAITSLDMNRCIVSWNKACEELYGFTAAEAMGKRIPELVTFEFPNSTSEKVFGQVYNTGQWKGEFNFIHPKTNIKTHLLSSINLLKSKEETIIGLIITSSDITDRKKAADDINKSNERFELIAQATNEAIWDHDFIKNETWGNKNHFNLYGFEPGTRKLNFEMFLERIHPDEREGIVSRMKAALEESLPLLSEEFRFKIANGEYRIFYDRAHIKYDADGKAVRLLGAMHDITDREKIKQQILKEKELSDSIINGLPGIFYLYNKEGKFLRWNKNFETVTGYTAAEISGMHPLDFFHKKDQPLLIDKIANVFIVGEDHVESDLLLKNKQMLPYYFTGQAIEYEGESCLMGVGLDFSEKEEAKKAILESETKYRELIEQASDGIFISDQNGKYIDVNSSACRILGYSKEELLNMSSAEILFHEKDAKGLPSRYSDLISGKSSILETSLKRKDGSILTVESNSKMLPDGRFIGIVRDLTERKKADKALRESEERYRALVENAPEALVVMDVNKQVFVSVSESATKLFKMSREDLLKIGPVDVSPEYQPDGRLSSEASIINIQKAIDGGKPVFEWTHCDKDGNRIPCEVWLVRLPSETDVLIRGSIVDITERNKAAEEIRTNSELLRELYSYSQNIREEERTYIAREIHDELGQQLTGLKMDLSWITRKLQSSDATINEKLSGTLSLVDTTIKTIRKIATELRPSILDDLGLVAALEWQSEEFEKRSDIKVIFTSNLDETILQPDITTALFRIYQELLTNVARHSEAKIVKTAIYINNNKLHLSVEDDGVGFDADNIINKKTLGLRGIKERTNLIGGNYEIKTGPGEGTFVLISVPLYNTIMNP